jgi:lipoprotein NlpI
MGIAMLSMGVLTGACWAQSNDDLKKCYENGPTNADLALRYCTAALQSGKLSQEDLANAFINRGNAYDTKGDHDRAIQDYDQAIGVNPKDGDAFMNRGSAYGNKGDRDRAIQDFDQAILLNPNDARAFGSRGIAYGNKGEYDRAIQDFDQAIRLNPNDAVALFNRGVAYDNKGEYDRAIQNFDRAIQLNPNSAEALFNRGVAYNYKGNFDRAIQNYDQFIHLNPNDTAGLFNRGVAQFCLGQFGLAQKDLAGAVQLQPKNLYNVIWSYLTQARAGKDARSDLQKNAAGLDLKQWPGMIIQLYLGKTRPDTVLPAAKDPDPKKGKGQLCEAYFYLSERSLLAGNPAEAIQLFQKTLGTGVTSFTEYTVAKEELRRLQSTPNH